MDSATFRKCGEQMVNFCADYMDTVHDKYHPLPEVTPGYLAKILPSEAPEQAESWDAVMSDIEPVILKGMSHWQHKMFFAYFPSGNSWSSIMGDIFSNATGVNGFKWDSCPVCTELEILVMDWAAKYLGLPKFFLSHFSEPNSTGGGSIQTSASDAILLSMIAARDWSVRRLRKKFPNHPRSVLMRQMVGYCSSQCHSCVEKGSMIALIRLRILEPDESGAVRADTLRAAIKEDKADGLIPFFYCAILGSTGICAFDDLMELGPICQENEMWLHADGAYAGSSFVCPEMRYISYGMQYVWSFNTNTNKWMLCNFDASLHWVRDKKLLIDCLSGSDQTLYSHPIVDFRYWGLPGTRRFRAFKLWVMIRNYGIKGLQNYIRSHVFLSKLFENYVRRDTRFEVVGAVRVGLVCFRLKGTNEVNKRLLEALNASCKIHMVPSGFHDKYVIRFAPCYEFLNEADIHMAWHITEEYASVVVRLYEQEMKDQVALKFLFLHQHEHDEEEMLHPDPVQEEEERLAMEEAKNILEHRDELKKTNALFAIAQALTDAYSSVNEDGIDNYDEFVLSHPEILEEKVSHWPSLKRHTRFFMNGHVLFDDEDKQTE